MNTDCEIKWVPRAERALGPVVLGILAALAAGCSKQQAAQPPRPPTTVSVGQVIQKSMPVEVTGVGNVEAISTISIRAQVPGEIKEVRFKEGDFVRKGQVLLAIDPRPYEAALDQAKAALARDKATSVYNHAQTERYKTLFQQGVVPAEQVDSLVSGAASSDAVVNSDEAAVKTAELNLEYCTIASPLDGRTGTIMVKPGNLVKVADVPIVVINQVNPIYVNFTVPQQYWPDIKEHMDRGRLPVRAIIPQDFGPPQTGTLTFVDNIVDATTGSIHLRGTFDNPQNRLWPGLFVNIVLTLSEQPNAVVAPERAIVATQQGSYVYVMRPNKTVERRTVVVSRTIEGESVIDKGLQPGETVITEGQINLIPDARVEIKNADAGAAAETKQGAGNSDSQANPPDRKTSPQGKSNRSSAQ